MCLNSTMAAAPAPAAPLTPAIPPPLPPLARPYVVTMKYFENPDHKIDPSLLPAEFSRGKAWMPYNRAKCGVCAGPVAAITLERKLDRSESQHMICRQGHRTCRDSIVYFGVMIPPPPDRPGHCVWEWDHDVIPELRRIVAAAPPPPPPPPPSDRPYMVTMKFFTTPNRRPPPCPGDAVAGYADRAVDGLFNIDPSLLPSEFRSGNISMAARKCGVCAELAIHMNLRRKIQDGADSIHIICRRGHRTCYDSRSRYTGKDGFETQLPDAPGQCKWDWDIEVIAELRHCVTEAVPPPTPALLPPLLPIPPSTL
jgi:hypothetical protein